VRRLVACCRAWGKTPIVVADCPGFLVNRLLLPFMNEAAWLLHDGAGIAQVDQVLKSYGMPMGAFRLADEVGLDVGHKVAAILAEGYGARMAVAPILRILAEEKKLLGRKGGAGFYRYRGEQESGVNPDCVDLLPPPQRAKPDAAEIRDRCLLIMVNEAARCLEEGIIPDPAQLDMALIYGTGFPPAHGGLLRWADRYGLIKICDRLDHFAQSHSRFAPAPLLRDLARRQGGFHGHA
jgi:3-hydroxyacyl-CoA dehydrogenase / enoyl-CoA hydratase / 3-hydroxybutyryl-CoA epimerase